MNGINKQVTDLTDDCKHRRGLGNRSGCVVRFFYRFKAAEGFAAVNVLVSPEFLSFP